MDLPLVVENVHSDGSSDVVVFVVVVVVGVAVVVVVVKEAASTHSMVHSAPAA